MNKYISKIAVVTAFVSFSFFTSCNSDDDNAQDTITINLTEVGSGNSGVVSAGSDLHLEAEIYASAKIATIEVELHHETDASAPEIHLVYTEYAGLLNADFHKHIDIPAHQPAGDYHLHLKVIDEKGNSKSVEAEVEITE